MEKRASSLRPIYLQILRGRSSEDLWQWGAFVLTRIFILVFMAGRGTDLPVHENYVHLLLIGRLPFRDFVPEYPPLTFAVTILPGLADPSLAHFQQLFRVLFLIVDLFTWITVRRANAGEPSMNFVYILATTALGPLLYDRVDLLLGLLLLLTVVALRDQRNDKYASLFGLAISLKLIPLMLIPNAILLLRQGVVQRARFVILSSAVILAPFLLLAALGSTQFSGMFSYHFRRGIQLESVPSSIEMLTMYLGAPGRVVYQFGCTELLTENSKPLSVIFSVLLLSIIVLSPLLSIAARGSRDKAGLIFSGVLCAGFCLSKVLSPQYFLIVLPLLSTLPRSPSRSTQIATLALLGLTYALTGLIFPWLYGRLTNLWNDAALLLGIRNIALVLLTAVLIRRCFLPQNEIVT